MKPLGHRWKRDGTAQPSTPTTTRWTWRCARCGKEASTSRTRPRPWSTELLPPPKPAPGDCGAELVRLVEEL